MKTHTPQSTPSAFEAYRRQLAEWRALSQKRREFQQFLKKRTKGSWWWKKTLEAYAKEEEWEIAKVEEDVNSYNHSWTWWIEWIATDISYKKEWLAYKKCEAHLDKVIPASVTIDGFGDYCMTDKAYEQIKSSEEKSFTQLQNEPSVRELPFVFQSIFESITSIAKNLWQRITQPSAAKQATPSIEQQPPMAAATTASPSVNLQDSKEVPSTALIVHPQAPTPGSADIKVALPHPESKKYYDIAYVTYTRLCTFLDLKPGVSTSTLAEIKKRIESLQKDLASYDQNNSDANKVKSIVATYDDFIKNSGLSLLSNLPIAPVPMSDTLKTANEANGTDKLNQEAVQKFLREQALKQSPVLSLDAKSNGEEVRLSSLESLFLVILCGGTEMKLEKGRVVTVTLAMVNKNRHKKLNLIYPDKAIASKMHGNLNTNILEKLKKAYTDTYLEFDYYYNQTIELFKARKNKPLVIPYDTFSVNEQLVVTQGHEYGLKLYAWRQYLDVRTEEFSVLDRDRVAINEMRGALLDGPLLLEETENNYLDQIEAYNKRCAQYFEEDKQGMQSPIFPDSIKKFLDPLQSDKPKSKDSTPDAKSQAASVQSSTERDPPTVRELCKKRREQEAEIVIIRAQVESILKAMMLYLQRVPRTSEIETFCSELSEYLKKVYDPAYTLPYHTAELEKYGKRYQLIIASQPAQTAADGASQPNSKLSDAKAILTSSGSSFFDATAKKTNEKTESSDPQSSQAAQPAPSTTPAAGVSPTHLT